MKTNITSILKNCINIIQKSQLPDGSFSHDSFSTQNNQTYSYTTNFIAGIILRTLSIPQIKENGNKNIDTILQDNIRDINTKIVNFLLTEKTPSLTWNYFSSQTRKLFSNHVFPNNLDTTFICLSGLYLWNKNIFSGDVWAHITKTLIQSEIKAGGPYYTWIINHTTYPQWTHVDGAVNANIAYFLYLTQINLPNLKDYLGKAEAKSHSSFYASSIMNAYFLSLSHLYKHILTNPKQDSLLENSLALSIAIRNKSPQSHIKNLFNKVIELYNKNNIQVEAFSIDPTQRGSNYFCGSKALTSVFVFESLILYQQYINNLKTKDPYRHLYIRTRKLIPANLITASIGNRGNEIMDYPIIFAKSVGLPANTGKMLAHANFFGWIAYYITDNILDENLNTQDISLSHICLRKMYLIYNKFVEKEKLKFCYQILNKMDCVQHTKEISQDKSIGQAIPFIIILFIKGFSPESPYIRHMLTFWRQYLFARQLSDDAHDWKQDLEKNIPNEVINMIQNKTSDPEQYTPVFWNIIFPEVIDTINKRLDSAQKAINALETKIDISIFTKLITSARERTKQAVTEKETLENFALHYNSSKTPESPKYTDQEHTARI